MELSRDVSEKRRVRSPNKQQWQEKQEETFTGSRLKWGNPPADGGGGGGGGGRETGRGMDRKGRQTDTCVIHAVQSYTVSNSGLTPPFVQTVQCYRNVSICIGAVGEPSVTSPRTIWHAEFRGQRSNHQPVDKQGLSEPQSPICSWFNTFKAVFSFNYNGQNIVYWTV